LLERSAEPDPLNGPSPSVPVSPLIIRTEPLRRTSRQRRLQQTGRIECQLDWNVLPPLLQPRGRSRLDLEFERMLAHPGAAHAIDPQVRSSAGDGIDAVDAIFHAVPRVGKSDSAVADCHVTDGESRCAGVAGRECWS
jgi:hypothetical protein